jgi:hypothetical protein
MRPRERSLKVAELPPGMARANATTKSSPRGPLAICGRQLHARRLRRDSYQWSAQLTRRRPARRPARRPCHRPFNNRKHHRRHRSSGRRVEPQTGLTLTPTRNHLNMNKTPLPHFNPNTNKPFSSIMEMAAYEAAERMKAIHGPRPATPKRKR